MNRFSIYTRHVNNDGAEEPGWGFYAIFHNNDFYKITDGADGTYANGTYCAMLFELDREEAILARLFSVHLLVVVMVMVGIYIMIW